MGKRQQPKCSKVDPIPPLGSFEFSVVYREVYHESMQQLPTQQYQKVISTKCAASPAVGWTIEFRFPAGVVNCFLSGFVLSGIWGLF